MRSIARRQTGGLSRALCTMSAAIRGPGCRTAFDAISERSLRASRSSMIQPASCDSCGVMRREPLSIRRFLSIWLPRLATDRARRLSAVDPRAPLAATAKVNNAERLVCVDKNAASFGLTVGLTLADARARRPELVVVEASPHEEARLLEKICDACSRFTPLAALDDRDGVMLDIAGVSHLFGGEAALARQALDRLAAQGLTALAGVAGNPRAAWALARFSAQKIA